MAARSKYLVQRYHHSVRDKETSAGGKSIYAHDPGGKVAEAYQNLTKEVLKIEKQREKVVEILLSDLHPFKNHPFKTKDDETMNCYSNAVIFMRP